MPMIPEDLCATLDVLAQDVEAVENAPDSPIGDKIRSAVEDWLDPLLITHGYVPDRHLTRREPTKLFTSIAGVFEDRTSDACGGGGTAIALQTVFAAPSTDAIYIGLDRPFRGLFVGLQDTVNTVGIASSVTYWNGQWTAVNSLVNDTLVSGAPFGKAGRIRWQLPGDWLKRHVNSEGLYWWVRFQVNSTPAACPVTELLPITKSRLTTPVALEALSRLYFEGWTGSERGDWKAKAEHAHTRADAAFQRVVGLIRDEFDVDRDGDVGNEVNSVVPEPWVWERG